MVAPQEVLPPAAPQEATRPEGDMEPEQPLVEDQTELPGGKAVEAEAEKPERRSPWTPEVIIQAFKEVVTALLGLAVVIYTLILARNTLALVGQPEKLADAKDVLLLILGLAGVVVGYYFGRVPADARASQAQQQTNEATARAEQVSAQTEILADEVDEVMDRMAPAAVTARGAKSLEGEAIVTGDLQRIRDDLRALSRLSRRR